MGDNNCPRSDSRPQGERYAVLQRWHYELPEQSDERFDLDWHPLIARRQRWAGLSMELDS
jgi:hypothetical protein